MERKQKSELVEKVITFIEDLKVKVNHQQLIFCIVKDDNEHGLMKFEGVTTELAKCFADYIRQQPELARIMIAALYANGYMGRASAFEMARKDYQEYKDDIDSNKQS